MQLYLMRHATPVSKHVDPEQPLAALGREQAQRMAAFLREAIVKGPEIFHSGKARARETAEIVATALPEASRPEKRSGLKPLDDLDTAVSLAGAAENELLLVGHLPHLSRLVSFLTTGSPDRELVAFPPAGVVCLLGEGEGGDWRIAWMIHPGLLQTANHACGVTGQQNAEVKNRTDQTDQID